MNYSIHLLFSLCCLLTLTGCTTATVPTPREGYVPVEGGRIWYKVVGNGPGTPLLVIHGGPGSRSCEGIPVYQTLGDDRPVVFYDQLGSGNSDRPTDTTLWNLPRFVNEITALRQHLNLQEVNILGNSWGAAVALEYMFTQNPKGVQSLVLSGPLISSSKWMEDAHVLLSQMPVHLQDTIRKYERLEMYDAPAYLAATDSFYVRHLSRNWGKITYPVSCDGVGKFNAQVYRHMWGPTEFKATGTLKNFDRSAQLKELDLPVLFVAGRYDEARPETMYEFQKKVKGSQVKVIENAGHMKTIDNPIDYIKVLRGFLF